MIYYICEPTCTCFVKGQAITRGIHVYSLFCILKYQPWMKHEQFINIWHCVKHKNINKALCILCTDHVLFFGKVYFTLISRAFFYSSSLTKSLRTRNPGEVVFWEITIAIGYTYVWCSRCKIHRQIITDTEMQPNTGRQANCNSACRCQHVTTIHWKDKKKRKKHFNTIFFQDIFGNLTECGLHMQEREHAKGQWPRKRLVFGNLQHVRG